MPSRTACATIAFAALAAVSASAQQDAGATAAAVQQDTAAAPAPALNYSPQRYRLLPPYADPGFVRGPVPPPNKNYLIPLGEVVAIDAGVWAFNYIQGKEFAQISWASVKQNFNKGWIVDTDDFWANGILHPLHGNLTFNAARSMGLNLYESFGYAFLGSLIWEQFAEIQPASLNDQVNTPFGGTMVGEVAFRLSRMVLDSGGYAPSASRQFFAFLINPVGGINRLMFGDKYRGELLLPTSWMGEFHFGLVIAGSTRTDAPGSRNTDVGPWASLSANIIYGIPGTPDLSLSKPFDHFEVSASFSFTSDITSTATSTLLVRGLLIGETIGPGGDEGGLWGLFTSYDFVAPAVFRVTGFGLGPGVALMKRWDTFELHGTGVAELLPWAGGGSTIPLGVRDYLYGPGAALALELRAHFGDRVILRLLGRQYWVSGLYARGSSEDISYGKAQATVRIYGMHGVSGGIDWGRRRAGYSFDSDIFQRASVATVYYTLLQGW